LFLLVLLPLSWENDRTTSATPSPGLELRDKQKIIKTEILLHLNLEIFIFFSFIYFLIFIFFLYFSFSLFIFNPLSVYLMPVQLTVD
jgi:hypothetical protein